MKQDWNTGPIGDVFLERYFLGELSGSQLQALESRLAVDPALQARLKALQDHNLVFESRFPAESIVPEIESAVKRATPVRRSPAMAVKSNWVERLFEAFRSGAMSVGAPPLGRNFQWAGALAILVLALVPMIMVKPFQGTEIVRLKGKQAELRLYRNTPVGPERISSGDSARAGEIIQVEFHPGGYAYGAIFSVDGNGSVTLHWPVLPNASTAWSTLSEYRLPQAFELDQAPGFERFYLLVSNRPVNLENLGSQVAASALKDEPWLAAQVPKSMKVIPFVLKKAAHP